MALRIITQSVFDMPVRGVQYQDETRRRYAAALACPEWGTKHFRVRMREWNCTHYPLYVGVYPIAPFRRATESNWTPRQGRGVLYIGDLAIS